MTTWRTQAGASRKTTSQSADGEMDPSHVPGRLSIAAVVRTFVHTKTWSMAPRELCLYHKGRVAFARNVCADTYW